MASIMRREHPQWSSSDTLIDPQSFFGKIRTVYASAVLKAQLEQLQLSGCFDMFTGKWMKCYDTRRIYGAKALPHGLPPSLFWESDIGKWIESVSYFLANPSTAATPYAEEFSQAVDKLIGDIEAFQHEDGYLNVYFTIVDPAGKFQNLRDMHEMYNAGHLLEGAIAHYRWTGSRRFLDIMIKNVACFMNAFGPDNGKRPGYPGHPEFELAVLRLYSVTKNPHHLQFANHMLEARGTTASALDGESFFMWEAKQRDDPAFGCWMRTLDDLAYHQSHKPLQSQDAILGHSVRAMYLITACADIGGDFLDCAMRLWADAAHKKMYVTGGVGSEPQSEGFSEIEYYLPSSTGAGGCYAETCASIAFMMVSERILSHRLHGQYRDILELCLYNAVLGGGSLDGKGFSYANKLATYGNESALRSEWFEVCCCPPNLCRTLGILPGYIWSAKSDPGLVEVDVYLYITAERLVQLPEGDTVSVSMESGMPWTGAVSITVKSPASTKILLRLPVAEWMTNAQFSMPSKPHSPGYVEVAIESPEARVDISFDMEVRLVYPNAHVHQDTLSVTRGPIVYVAEDVDNHALESSNPHFELVGISESAKFTSSEESIAGIPVICLSTDDVFTLEDNKETGHMNGQQNGHLNCVKHNGFGKSAYSPLWNTVRAGSPVRSWKKASKKLSFVPWFARGNRGGKGHLRVPFLRVGNDTVLLS